MNDGIRLCDGTVVPFDIDNISFHTNVEWCGSKVDLFLICPPGDDDGISSVQYTANSIIGDPERTYGLAWKTVTDHIIPMLDMEVPSDVLSDVLEPVRIYVIYSASAGIGKPRYNRVEIAFALLDDDPDEETSYTVAGSLEEGFDDFYANEDLVDTEDILRPHELSTGDILTYTDELGAYFGTVDFLGDEPEVYIEPNESYTSAEHAFEVFEKVYQRAEVFRDLAMTVIREEVTRYIEVLRDRYSDPSLSVDGIMDELYLETFFINNNGEIEFAYEASGISDELRITAIGNYNRGFIKVLIEDADGE